MQIVIDIDEKEYKRILKGNWIGNSMAEMFEDGTVLPENHGQLKDVNDLKKSLRDFRAFHKTLEQALDETPTILEVREDDEE